MGFKISQEFPPRFLKGDEFAGKEMKLTIKEIKKEKVYSRQKNENQDMLVIYFEGGTRGVLLKKERATDIKNIHGDDTDEWIGKDVIMYTEKKKARDGIFDVIRFKESV